MGERSVDPRPRSATRRLAEAPPGGEATARDVQSVVARALHHLTSATDCDRAVAWMAHERGEVHAVGGAAPDEATAALPSELPPELLALSEPTDLGRGELPAALRELAEAHGVSAAAAVRSEGGEALAVLLVGGGQNPLGSVRPRTLAALAAAARNLATPLEAAAAARRLARLDEDVQRLDRLAQLGDLLAEIAHEIRNPLVSMKTFLQLLPDRIDDPEFRTRFLGVVSDELRRMERLLDVVLEHARPRAAAPPGAPARVSRVIDSVARLLAYRARDEGVALCVDAPETLPDVSVNEDALRQVLLNLALNGLDVTPRGGTVRLAAQPAEGGVELRVEDEGPGIPEPLRRHVFEPFFSTRPDRAGGLGLSISRRIVEEVGGRITLADHGGSGTAFRIFLPAESR